MIQNQVLRVATGCHLKTAASHLRAETGVLPLRAHLEMCCQQFYASALQPLLPSHLIVTSPPTPAPTPRATLQASYHRSLRGLRVRGDDPNSHLRGHAGRGRLAPGQTLPPRPDDRGDHPIAGTQQGSQGHPSSNCPSRSTATAIIPERPLTAPFRPFLTAHVLPSLRKLGRQPHLPRLPLHRPQDVPPLKLSHSSHGPSHGRFVDGTHPGSSIPGRASTV